MTKVIKSKSTPATPEFFVNDIITWTTWYNDGRYNEVTKHLGVVTKVNRVTLVVTDDRGNTWKVDKADAKNMSGLKR